MSVFGIRTTLESDKYKTAICELVTGSLKHTVVGESLMYL